MDPRPTTLSILRLWTITLDTFGGPGRSMTHGLQVVDAAFAANFEPAVFWTQKSPVFWDIEHFED